MTRKKVTSGIVRAIGYARVSTGMQARSGLGLTDQRAQIENEVSRRGWQVVEIAEDAGLSGKALTRREVLSVALAKLDRGDAEVLIAAKLDRTSRSVRDLAWLLERSSRKGWALVALDSDVDTSRPSGRFVMQVIGAAAEYERPIIGERTATAHSVRRSRGLRAGQTPILSRQVRERIVTIRLNGQSLGSIARTLTAESIPTARGGQWYASTVAHVLRSCALDDILAASRISADDGPGSSG